MSPLRAMPCEGTGRSRSVIGLDTKAGAAMLCSAILLAISSAGAIRHAADSKARFGAQHLTAGTRWVPCDQGQRRGRVLLAVYHEHCTIEEASSVPNRRTFLFATSSVTSVTSS